MERIFVYRPYDHSCFFYCSRILPTYKLYHFSLNSGVSIVIVSVESE